LFAVAIVRPLSPAQYGVTLRLASMNPEEFPTTLSPDDLDRRMQQQEGAGRGLTSSLEQPTADFQVSVDEALFLSNSDRVAKDLLRNGKDTLLEKLQSISDPSQRADLAIRGVTCRPPEPSELETVKQFFEQRADRPDTACQQVVWSLLMSSELRFNY
jgi:hypothetical protein